MKNSEYLDCLLEEMSDAPDTQLNTLEASKIKSLMGGEAIDTCNKLEDIITDCGKFSLASDFVMSTLEIIISIASVESKEDE